MLRFQRHQVDVLLARLKERPERLIVVSGPRQTGKTTLVRQALHHTELEWRYIPIGEPKPEDSFPGFEEIQTVEPIESNVHVRGREHPAPCN